MTSFYYMFDVMVTLNCKYSFLIAEENHGCHNLSPAMLIEILLNQVLFYKIKSKGHGTLEVS